MLAAVDENGRGWHPTACRRRASGQFAAIGVFRRRSAGPRLKRVSGEGLTWKPTVKSRGGVRERCKKMTNLLLSVLLSTYAWPPCPGGNGSSTTFVDGGICRSVEDGSRASSLPSMPARARGFLRHSRCFFLLPRATVLALRAARPSRSRSIATVKVTAAIRAASQSNHCLVSATTGGQMPRPSPKVSVLSV